MSPVLANVIVTFVLAAVSVSLWTLRVAVTSAGRRWAGAGVAGVEALVFTVAFGRIVANLGDAAGLLAYAGGVCCGTLLGLVLDERLSTGQSWVRVIVEGHGAALVGHLTRRGWPVTTLAGQGPTGPVTELLLGVDDKNLAALQRDIDVVAPFAFRTVERLRTASAPQPVLDLRQMGASRPTRHRGRRHATAARSG